MVFFSDEKISHERTQSIYLKRFFGKKYGKSLKNVDYSASGIFIVMDLC